MAKKKKEGTAVPNDGKQGRTRCAFGHEIVTGCEGDTWSVRVFFGKQLRVLLEGLPYEGDAYWAGDDWAHLHRVLVADSKVSGQEYAPVVIEGGEEVVRLSPRRSPIEALEYAEQYIDAMRLADREKVKQKRTRRAEYILKMQEFDAIDAGIEQKIADLKDALKISTEAREEYIEQLRNPQVTMNFVFDRKRAKQGDLEDMDGDATDLLTGLGMAPPRGPDIGKMPPKKGDDGDDARP